MLGVKRYKVLLVPFDEDWAFQYEITKEQIMPILGDNVIHMYHVGSTAIKGIAAKPIIDVAVEIKSVEALNIKDMIDIGYDWCGEDGKNRYLFVKRENGDMSTHHIHCYLEGSEDLQATVSFCDFLNSHPEYAKQYSDLKEELAVKYAEDRVAYTKAKADFITKIISIAQAKK